jgi:hypothetical protein
MRYLPSSDPRGCQLAWGPGRRRRRWRRVRHWVLAVLSLGMLAGCSGYVERYQQVKACQAAAGPEPNPGAANFGLIGAMYRLQQPEHNAWGSRVDDCFARARAAASVR